MRAICFDLDGTLLHFTRDYRDVLRDAITDVRGDATDADLDAYDEAFFERFTACDPDPVRGAFAAVDGETDVDALTDALRRRETEMCAPPAGAAADLARLREEYLLGVVTNGVSDWQRHKLAASGLREYFDTVVVSYEVGAHKPDNEPFAAAEERLPADEFAIVGDSDADIEGGASVGWATYRYEGEGFASLPDAIDWQ